MSDVFNSLVSSKAFLRTVEHLTVCDASGGDEPTSLSEFARRAAKLEGLYLRNCTLRSDMLTFTETLKDREVQHLCLERCVIGCNSADADREAILAAMATYLKLNKFLISLDLSYTNLDAAALGSLMTALTESETRMLPQDMSETPDNYDPSSFGDRITAEDFVIGARKNSTGESEFDRAAEDLEDDAEDKGEASLDDAGGESDGEEGEVDEEEGSENEEEEEEGEERDGERGMSSGRHQKEAEKERKRLERERLKMDRQQQRLHQKEIVQLAQREAETRRTLMGEYLSGVGEIVAPSSAAMAACYSEEKRKAKEMHCARRSGWCHLQALVLRGNRLGDAGAKQIALVLREEVPLADDEAKQRQESADEMRTAFSAALSSSRAAIAAEEIRAWRALRQAAKAGLEGMGHAGNGEAPLADGVDGDEEDEYAKEAPPVVLTNVESHRGSGEEDVAAPTDDAADGLVAEERRRWEEWAVEGVPPIAVPPVKKGMRSVTLLDLGSCHIGKKGLQALAEVLRTNTVLESLCLRHNPLGSAVAKVAAAHVDAASTISEGFAAFVEMLCVNKTLHTLDLGYCQLGPQHVRTLATALHVNSGLATLGLEGNQLGADEAYQQKKCPHSYLYDLWMSAAQPGSALRHLHLSHNSIAVCLWPEEAEALVAACGKLFSLSLSHVGFEELHLQRWLEAVGESSAAQGFTVRKLQLSRNELAGEAAGKVLGLLLQYFSALEELAIDDHPLLGSAGVAAALSYLPDTMRSLSCGGTGLTEPLVGAVQAPVIPPSVAAQLTSLALCDVDAPTPETLGLWATHLAEAARQMQFLSLWARGMAGKEHAVLPYMVELVQACPSLLYVDCGYQSQFQTAFPGAEHFVRLEEILLPRRMSPPTKGG